jgi:hypothetical protein
MTINAIPAVRVPRSLDDRDYGREEYIEGCIQKILRGEEAFISTGGFVSAESLPPVLREKYSGFFPGFSGALDEVVQAVQNAGNKVIVKPLPNGGLYGDPDSGPDGYFLSLDRDVATKIS